MLDNCCTDMWLLESYLATKKWVRAQQIPMHTHLLLHCAYMVLQWTLQMLHLCCASHQEHRHGSRNFLVAHMLVDAHPYAH